MRFLFTINILIIFCFSSFAQKTIKIGTQVENIYPFDLNQANLYLDWTKTAKYFDSIKVFGMGEATHGTKEFFEIKRKTFEYLVLNYNYKVFGIEASYGECNFINDFLCSGIGNIDTSMQYFSFWTWKTEEVKDLILWIKEYNLSRIDENKISFYGFDMQDIYTPVQYFYEFFKSDTSEFADNIMSITKPILSKTSWKIYKLFIGKDSSVFRDTLNRINKELNEWMKKNEPLLKQRYSNKRINQLQLCLDTYKQAINNTKSNFIYRDSCMARNIITIQHLENSKMFIWAHNAHINFELPSERGEKIQKKMGGFLKEELGQKYYAVGFVFNQGYFQAIKWIKNSEEYNNKHPTMKKNFHTELVECYLPSYKKNTLTNKFSSSDIDNFFIDIRYSGNSIFSKPIYTYSVGSFFMKKKISSRLINAKKQFDGLIYINKTTSAIPINSK
jgi:erythromycin esterase